MTAAQECVLASTQPGASTPDEVEALMRKTHMFKSRRTQSIGDDGSLKMVSIASSGLREVFFSTLKLYDRIAAITVIIEPLIGGLNSFRPELVRRSEAKIDISDISDPPAD